MSSYTTGQKKNYIIPLNSILQHDKLGIEIVSESLQTKGYAYIKLPENIVQEIDTCLKSIELFFAKSKEQKKKYFKAPIFGYFDVDHKESFRVLTGSRIAEQEFPFELLGLKKFIHTIDQIMYSMTLSLS